MDDGQLTLTHRRLLDAVDGAFAPIYDTLSAAESDAALIRPDGNPKNVAIDLLWGRLMWWAKGRVIVNYNFDDPAISGSLTETMGTSLSPQGNSFSQPPDLLPVSEACPGQP